MYRKVAFYGMILCLTLLVSYIEAIVPIPIPIPGVKLGLANGVLLFLMYKENIGATALISVLRVVLISFLFGNASAMIYSMSGAVLSLLVMAIMKRIKALSIVGVSMAGGTAHNIAQLSVAMFVTETGALIYYLPVLMVAGVITGFLIGVIMLEVNKKLIFLTT